LQSVRFGGNTSCPFATKAFAAKEYGLTHDGSSKVIQVVIYR